MRLTITDYLFFNDDIVDALHNACIQEIIRFLAQDEEEVVRDMLLTMKVFLPNKSQNHLSLKKQWLEVSLLNTT